MKKGYVSTMYTHGMPVKAMYYPKFNRWYLYIHSAKRWIRLDAGNYTQTINWLLHILARAKENYLSVYNPVHIIDNERRYANCDVYFVVSEDRTPNPNGYTRYVFVEQTTQEEY